MVKKILYLLLAFFGMHACIKLPETTSIVYYEVRKNADGGKIIATIEDRNKIESLLTLIQENNKGWYTPANTLPAATYDFLFYNKDKALVFQTGIGSNFLVNYEEQKIKSIGDESKNYFLKFIPNP